jgi:hypothetical protein
MDTQIQIFQVSMLVVMFKTLIIGKLSQLLEAVVWPPLGPKDILKNLEESK